MTLETLINKSTIRVEAENHTCYWTADGYKFDNANLALWYETDRQSYVSYVDSQIDIIRGYLQTSIDMECDYNKQFLHYLRTSYEQLNLYFSGGADSLTILETAHLNNISFDKIICQTCDDINLECNREIKRCAIPVLEKYKLNYNIVSTTWQDHFEKYSSEYSFFTNPMPNVLPFRACPDSEVSYKAQDACYIVGKDKPQLVKHNKKWYVVLMDTQSSVTKKNPFLKSFWLDAFNIKSYVKDAILYKEYLLENDLVNKNKLQFFKPDQNPVVNGILKRSKVHMAETQLLKNINNYTSSKNLQRIVDAISNQRMDVLVNYFSAMKKFNSVLPDYAYKNAPGRFAWFIDLDSLEVFTQQELIPDGF